MSVTLKSLVAGVRQSDPKMRALLAANTAKVIQASNAVPNFDPDRFKAACKRDA
jgi:hypothetical protein